MRVAYLIFAYKNPKLIRRTIERLSCEDASFFLHIDRKSNLNDFAGILGDNVFFTGQRLAVSWAEFSGVRAILLLMRQALASQQPHDYLVLLSGSEYPLRSREYLHNFLEANRGMEFMTAVRMPNAEAGKPISRITTPRIQSSRPVYRAFVKGLAKLRLARRDYRKYLGTLEPYAGNTWWALTREACQHIVAFEQENQRVVKFFEDTFAPEEMFFHTILGNSPFRSRMRRNLVYEDWSSAGGHPAKIDDKHIAFFGAQEAVCVEDIHGPGELLFARKLSDENLEIARKIDEMAARKEEARIGNSTCQALQA